MDGRGDVAFFDRDVEVAVATALRAQPRVHRPTTVEPRPDAGLVHDH
jgi:hypothetical protein